jgi:serine/threonine protein phosphatase 1
VQDACGNDAAILYEDRSRCLDLHHPGRIGSLSGGSLAVGKTVYGSPTQEHTSLFGRQTSQREAARAGTDGRMVYAVGDIHGRLDLLRLLLSKIEADSALSRPSLNPILVFVGDYVDRGPSSKGVVDRIIKLQLSGAFEVRALLGNHERTLLDFLKDPQVGPIWARHGGVETLLDYGASPPAIEAGADAWAEAQQSFAARLPARHLRFFSSLSTWTVCGDYLFVHAGVRHGVPLDKQSDDDLLTIRRDFLVKETPFEKVVVHGHTPAETAFSGRYRINVDTGAYATGVLTAVRLEDASRRFLQVRANRSATERKPTLSSFRARWLAG